MYLEHDIKRDIMTIPKPLYHNHRLNFFNFYIKILFISFIVSLWCLFNIASDAGAEPVYQFGSNELEICKFEYDEAHDTLEGECHCAFGSVRSDLTGRCECPPGITGGFCLSGEVDLDICNVFPFSPLCGDNDPPPPPPPPGPEKPTEAGCRLAQQKCYQNIAQSQDDCNRDGWIYAIAITSEGLTCHGDDAEIAESVHTLLDKPCGLDRVRNDPICERRFLGEAMWRCQHGTLSKTVSETSSVGGNLEIENPFAKFALSAEATLQVSTTFPERLGSRQRCAALSTLAQTQCDEKARQCQARAKETQQGPPLPDPTADQLIAQIDLEKLLLKAPLGMALPPNRQLQSVSQSGLESDELYIARLQFLLGWSDFLKRPHLAASVQRAIESRMAGLQARLDARDRLLTAYAADIMMTSPEFPPDEIFAQLDESFPINLDLWIELEFIEKLLSDLSTDERQAFVDLVWPGVKTFQAMSPMRPIRAFGP